MNDDETNAEFAARMRMKRWCAERRRKKEQGIPYRVDAQSLLKRPRPPAVLYLDTV